jgi:hypothetical protein
MLSLAVVDRDVRALDDTGLMLEASRPGQLMRRSGLTASERPPPNEIGLRLPWRGSLPVVERRLRELTMRRDDARVRLEAVLAESDARRDMKG